MQDLRNEMEINTIRGEIEKRAHERIGLILRMADTSQMKITVLGWFKGLEGEKKPPE